VSRSRPFHHERLEILRPPGGMFGGTSTCCSSLNNAHAPFRTLAKMSELWRRISGVLLSILRFTAVFELSAGSPTITLPWGWLQIQMRWSMQHGRSHLSEEVTCTRRARLPVDDGTGIRSGLRIFFRFGGVGGGGGWYGCILPKTSFHRQGIAYAGARISSRFFGRGRGGDAN
jgi:hypothetical protein